MSYEGSLKDKVALVTGASRGIGHGILLALAKASAKVVGTATTSKGADKITKLCKFKSIDGLGLVLDVRDRASIEKMLKEVKAHFGPINILVNNAAINSDNLILRMKDEEWEGVIDTDLSAIFRLSKRCLKDMLKAKWGRIINISSVVGFTGNAGQANYCAAKAGIAGFSKAVALEVGSRNITVNVVAPGFVATDMTNMLNEEQKEVITSRIPMNKIGKIEDIAEAVCFLASDAAGYITGQTLHVNGGMYMP